MDDGNDKLTGSEGVADFFSCGTGIDTITEFNAAAEYTKTADYENLLVGQCKFLSSFFVALSSIHRDKKATTEPMLKSFNLVNRTCSGT